MNNAVIEEKVREITSVILADYDGDRDIDRLNVFDKPDKQKVIDLTEKLIKIVFPGYYREKSFKMYNAQNSLTVLIEDVFYRLNQQILLALRFREGDASSGDDRREEEGFNEKINILFYDHRSAAVRTAFGRLRPIGSTGGDQK